MKKHPSKIIRDILLQEGYNENADGSFTHPYENALETSRLAKIRRKLRLQGRMKR